MAFHIGYSIQVCGLDSSYADHTSSGTAN